MKVVIISDTHGHAGYLERVIEEEWPVSALIHCGDLEGEEDYIEALAECPFYYVSGNNDYFSRIDGEQVFMLGGKRIFLTHGHYYGVSMGTERLRKEAQLRKADIAMFGHTHRPHLEVYNDITMVNPGSLAYPRQSPRKRTYMVMDIDSDGEVQFSLKYIK